jgi:hypothetical protein
LDERQTLDVWNRRRRVAMGGCILFWLAGVAATVLRWGAPSSTFVMISFVPFACAMLALAYASVKQYRAYVAFKMALGYSKGKAREKFGEEFPSPTADGGGAVL